MKGRVHEHNVEGRASALGKVGVDTGAHHLTGVGFQQAQVVAQGPGQGRGVVHQGRGARAPGQGLQAERSGAGEQIQAVLADQVERQPVEQGFPGPGRGRAYPAGVRKA